MNMRTSAAIAPPTWRLRNSDPKTPASDEGTGRIDSGSSDSLWAAAAATRAPERTSAPSAQRARYRRPRSTPGPRSIAGADGTGVAGVETDGAAGTETDGAAGRETAGAA